MLPLIEPAAPPLSNHTTVASYSISNKPKSKNLPRSMKKIISPVKNQELWTSIFVRILGLENISTKNAQ